MMLSRRFAATVAGAVAVAFLSSGADWRQFRGTDNRGVSDTRVPTTWSVTENEESNLAWKVALPGEGVSSPIVVDGRVFVTCASGPKQDRLHVVCLDSETGKRLWERQFWATGRTICHPTSSVAAPTPASDGRLVMALFSSNDLVCLDLEGNLRWLRGLTADFPTAANDVGMASSLLVAGKTVVAQVECEGESFAAGMDTANGLTRWKIPRARQMNWSSPALLPRGDDRGDVVLLQSATRLTAHDAESGAELWSHQAGCSTIASPVADRRVVYLPSEGLTALQSTEGSRSVDVLWRENRLSTDNASPVVHDGKVYAVNGAGVLNCGDAASGEVLWQLRLKGPFWATPVLAAGHLFLVNQDGRAHVVKIGEKGELVGTSEFGEEIYGSPAVADGALYVRSNSRLWKIAENAPRAASTKPHRVPRRSLVR